MEVLIVLLVIGGVYYAVTQGIGDLVGRELTPDDSYGTAQDRRDAKVKAFAYAISVAEGFGVPGAVPTTHNNPGDLGPGDTGFPGDVHSGSTVSQLPDVATGWQKLYDKLNNIFDGNSAVYSMDMTILQFAQKYAGDFGNWANNVSSTLGVSTDTTLADWYAQ